MSGSATTAVTARRARGWTWGQLLVGWLPVWGLYAAMMISMHGGPVLPAMLVAARAIAAAALLGIVVLRLTDHLPWPRPMRPAFVLAHVVGAVVYAVAWVLLASTVEAVVRARYVLLAPGGVVPFLSVGIWLYVGVAGVAYASRATARAAEAEAAAVRARLEALRGQLNPHFLFNALHTVVQLIPVEPARAGEAAERLAELLRAAIAEDRDLVPLREERGFVERYLALEALRFGDRLRVRFDRDADLDAALVPAFAMQTLVENAVRHGASPREAPTTVRVEVRRLDGGAARAGAALQLTVSDDGAGGTPDAGHGTGLARLRERLQALFGDRASLTLTGAPGSGFSGTLIIPIVDEDDG